MDIIDVVTYRWEPSEKVTDMPEETRRAFVALFDSTDDNATLVARHLVMLCKWTDQTEYNDPVIEAKMNSLRGIIIEIKKQLNMLPIVNEEPEEDEV